MSGPARGRGGRLRSAETQEGPNVRLPRRGETRAHATARPSLAVMINSAPPVYDGLVIIHTGGARSVMPSDSPHMSVCVDQPLSADSNEPVGRGGAERVPIQYYFHLVLSTCRLLECAC